MTLDSIEKKNRRMTINQEVSSMKEIHNTHHRTSKIEGYWDWGFKYDYQITNWIDGIIRIKNWGNLKLAHSLKEKIWKSWYFIYRRI